MILLLSIAWPCRSPALNSVIISNAAGVVSSAKASVRVAQVAAWGGNFDGQTDVPQSLDGVMQVTGGDYHSLALRADGTVVGWGAGGNNQTVVPFTLTNAIAIAAGNYHSLALRADGTVEAWGAGTANTNSTTLIL